MRHGPRRAGSLTRRAPTLPADGRERDHRPEPDPRRGHRGAARLVVVAAAEHPAPACRGPHRWARLGRRRAGHAAWRGAPAVRVALCRADPVRGRPEPSLRRDSPPRRGAAQPADDRRRCHGAARRRERPLRAGHRLGNGRRARRDRDRYRADGDRAHAPSHSPVGADRGDAPRRRDPRRPAGRAPRRTRLRSDPRHLGRGSDRRRGGRATEDRTCQQRDRARRCRAARLAAPPLPHSRPFAQCRGDRVRDRRVSGGRRGAGGIWPARRDGHGHGDGQPALRACRRDPRVQGDDPRPAHIGAVRRDRRARRPRCGRRHRRARGAADRGARTGDPPARGAGLDARHLGELARAGVTRVHRAARDRRCLGGCDLCAATRGVRLGCGGSCAGDVPDRRRDDRGLRRDRRADRPFAPARRGQPPWCADRGARTALRAPLRPHSRNTTSR